MYSLIIPLQHQEELSLSADIMFHQKLQCIAATDIVLISLTVIMKRHKAFILIEWTLFYMDYTQRLLVRDSFGTNADYYK